MKSKLLGGFLAFSLTLGIFSAEKAYAFNEKLVEDTEVKIEQLQEKQTSLRADLELKQQRKEEVIFQLELIQANKESLIKTVTSNDLAIKESLELSEKLQEEILDIQEKIIQESKKNPIQLKGKVFKVNEIASSALNKINSYKEDINKLTEEDLAESKKREDLLNVKKSAEDSILELNVLLEESNVIKEEVETKIQVLDSNNKDLEKEKSSLQEIINNELGMKEELSDGILEWPTVGGYISSGMGPRTHPKTGEVGKYHKGIDIARTNRSYSPPIYAAESGVVVEAKEMGGYGNMVMIQHNDGKLQTLYGHLSEIKVEKGQKVRRGQTIGIMGKTGLSTGIHLHFEVYDEGLLKNPIEYYR